MGFYAHLRLFLDLVSMVYLHLVPVFNRKTGNEERGWLCLSLGVLSFGTSLLLSAWLAIS